MKLNKALLTHLTSIALIIIGYYLQNSVISNIAIFAISGSITNNIAIHMLFEKVPFLYGSGVIQNRFTDFKIAIKNLIHAEFFNQNNINKLLASKKDESLIKDLFAEIDLEKAFIALKQGIMESQLGTTISMFGGEAMLEKIKDPVKANLNKMLVEIGEDLKKKEHLNNVSQKFLTDIDALIEQRLAELTPKMVKDIIQDMIRKHLGWLVVWGGLFGGLIGLLYSLI